MRRTLRPGSADAGGRSASVGPVRVATFNLLHGRSVTDGQVEAADLRAAAAALDADVVGLQEVDRAQPRSLRRRPDRGRRRRAGRARTGASSRRCTARRADAGWTASTRGRRQRRTTGPATASGWSRDCRCSRGTYAGSGRRRSGMPLMVPGTRGLTHVATSRGSRVAAVLDGPAGPLTVVDAHLSFVPGWNVAQLRALARWARDVARRRGCCSATSTCRGRCPRLSTRLGAARAGGDVPLVASARAVRPRARGHPDAGHRRAGATAPGERSLRPCGGRRHSADLAVAANPASGPGGGDTHQVCARVYQL